MFAIFLKRNNWMYGNLILYNLAKEMFLEPSYLAQKSRNVVYTRWGKKSCPSNAELVHSGKYPYYILILYFKVLVINFLNMNLKIWITSGYVGGSHYNNRGAAVEPICLPRNPEWGVHRDGMDGQKAYVYGAEYQMHTVSGYMRQFHDQDVPCALCVKRNKSVVQMFPGEYKEF